MNTSVPCAFVAQAMLLSVLTLWAAAARAGGPVECDTRSRDGPVAKPWRSFKPDPAYHGQWLVAGDLDGDGAAEIVTARNDAQRVTAAVASRLDGSALWKWGRADAGRQGLGYDVPLQLYDLDGDGKDEVYLSIRGFLVVLDGATGKEIRRLALPKGLSVADCITFVNLRGLGRARDVIVKDRYRRLWAYTGDWKPLWHWAPRAYPSRASGPNGRTCHHPTPVDLDGDGRDEIIAGYTVLGHDGKALWTVASAKANLRRGHVDCSEVMRTGKKPEEHRFVLTYCGANGMSLVDGTGKVLWEVVGHHFESADCGRIRDDIPGDQIVVDIDHLPFGRSRVWLVDARGNLLVDFKCGYGRHHRLIDWDGDGLLEILIGNTRKLFDGKGKCVVRFGPKGAFDAAVGPQRGNDPGPFAAVGDLDGDGRPEVILHSTRTVRIYKSANAPKARSRRVGTGVNFTLY